ncbi:uncharacterized protein LOC125578008 isoform X1 [Brassica napus]|uniref:uncharacterized protein LOC125578008 isoform X1 n=1 Tax=Brassica napus TaxID=3708 RepID=UPI0020788617|nr:uncharacterized protein LOC125578008 isoform X1 [Brassica napus]
MLSSRAAGLRCPLSSSGMSSCGSRLPKTLGPLGRMLLPALVSAGTGVLSSKRSSKFLNFPPNSLSQSPSNSPVPGHLLRFFSAISSETAPIKLTISTSPLTKVEDKVGLQYSTKPHKDKEWNKTSEQLPYGLDLQKDVFVERLAAAKTFLVAQVNSR